MNIPNVQALVKELNAPLIIFDLETSAFRGAPNFGITEAACIIVSATDKPKLVSSLINPEAPISDKVVELNGITNAMVASADTWGARFAPFFKKNSKTAWFSGFNSNTFDIPAVKEMNAKYGHPIESINTFDIRTLYLDVLEPANKKGTLEEVAKLFGVPISDKLHRAKADVYLTVMILEQLIAKFGLKVVLNRILADSTKKMKSANIIKYIKNKKTPVSIEEMAKFFETDASLISFEICKLIDEKLIDHNLFANEKVISEISVVIPEIPKYIVKLNKLKPVYDYISSQLLIDNFDYIQLRLAMLRHNMTWSSLKND